MDKTQEDLKLYVLKKLEGLDSKTSGGEQVLQGVFTHR